MTARLRLGCTLALLIVAGCSRQPSSGQPSSDAPAGSDAAAALNEQIAGDMTAVRLKMAEARITQLERQVGALQNTPEKLDLQLLTQRLETLEARAYAGAGKDPAEPRREPRPEPQPTASPTPNRFNPFGL